MLIVAAQRYFGMLQIQRFHLLIRQDRNILCLHKAAVQALFRFLRRFGVEIDLQPVIRGILRLAIQHGVYHGAAGEAAFLYRGPSSVLFIHFGLACHTDISAFKPLGFDGIRFFRAILFFIGGRRHIIAVFRIGGRRDVIAVFGVGGRRHIIAVFGVGGRRHIIAIFRIGGRRDVIAIFRIGGRRHVIAVFGVGGRRHIIAAFGIGGRRRVIAVFGVGGRRDVIAVFRIGGRRHVIAVFRVGGRRHVIIVRGAIV